MDALSSIFTWLGNHEAGISAVAAILAFPPTPAARPRGVGGKAERETAMALDRIGSVFGGSGEWSGRAN
jgi:hypothetical protein